MHVFISSRLDYCDSLLYCVSYALLKKLQQTVQNACSGGDGSTNIRPHHAGASRISLTYSPSENQIQAGDDSLQVPTRTGADVLGNLCHCRQTTPALRWYGVTVSTKDKDHAGDEEFRGRWSSYLEQFTSRPTYRNFSPYEFRSTSEVESCTGTEM